MAGRIDRPGFVKAVPKAQASIVLLGPRGAAVMAVQGDGGRDDAGIVVPSAVSVEFTLDSPDTFFASL